MKRRTRVASALACLGIAAAAIATPTTASAQLFGGGGLGGGGAAGVRTEAVRSARGFGGGNIHYPTSASGALPVVAVAPGFTASESTIRWFGPELAQHGMVVITIETNGRMDQPPQRGQQLNAALQHVISNPPSGVQVDATKLGAMGHSMGGGGTLTAASQNREIDAIVPLTAWHMSKNWRSVQAAALVVGAQNDAIASTRSHSIPFYESLGGPKAYIEFRGASHMMPNRRNATLGNYASSWMKLWLKGDQSAAEVVCQNNSAFSAYESTCPFNAPSGGSTGGGSTPTTPPATGGSTGGSTGGLGGGSFGGGLGGLGGGSFGGGSLGGLGGGSLGGLGGGSLGGLGGGSLGGLGGGSLGGGLLGGMGGGSLLGGSSGFGSLFSGMFSGGGGSSLLGGMFGM